VPAAARIIAPVHTEQIVAWGAIRWMNDKVRASRLASDQPGPPGTISTSAAVHSS
jgi:hypothetical protein